VIKSRIKAEKPDANLGAYEEAYRTFSWAEVESEFSWKQGERINIVYESIDRKAAQPEHAQRPALIVEKRGKLRTLTFSDLQKLSCQWANLLVQHGLGQGDRLFLFLDPCPEIYFAMLGCARLGAVFCPLYPTLRYDEMEDRLTNARPKLMVTHPDLAEHLPHEGMETVEHILLVRGPASGLFAQEKVIEDLPDQMPDEFEPTFLHRDAPLYLLYTSGSTGPPKGVVHAHRDMLGLKMTGRFVLDLDENSVLWTDGHPAWVTGTVYGTFAPWLCGATSVVQEEPFSASTWYRTLERHHVTTWYTTPSTIRRLMDEGGDLPKRYDYSRLRHISTVGEALGPELFHWVRSNLRLVPHDTWWMTETGMICLANFPSMDTKPGSMGKPVPGVKAAVLGEDGSPLPMLTLGQLALKPDWPCLLKEIWQDEERFHEYLRIPGWFLTGDMVLEDEEGYFFHQGRMDDLIKLGEKLIGPYEIEQLLCRHPAVHEAAVISRETTTGRPALKGFVAITEGFTPSTRLNHELRQFVRAHLAPHASLIQIDFVEGLPKTRSGKLIRRVLRAKELGLPG
jgi:acetyl-CoA synthetase